MSAIAYDPRRGTGRVDRNAARDQETDLELVERDLIIRIGGMIMALGGVLVAVKFLGR